MSATSISESPDRHPSPGSGEAGKTALALVVHAALASFDSFAQAAFNGARIPSCTLTTQALNGDTVLLTLQNVYVDSVNAIASSATSRLPRYAYVAASLAYGRISINESNGVDDGGASPASDKSQQ